MKETFDIRPKQASMIHELKTLPIYFESVARGIKTFEVRRDDRNFTTGDRLLLREWKPPVGRAKKGKYTGRTFTVVVTYITNFGQPDGQVVMAIR